MKKILHIPTLLLFLTLGVPKAQATHIVGGEMMYEYLGSGNYQITMFMYFDCLNGSQQALEMDSVANIAVYSPVTKVIHRYARVRYSKRENVKNVNYSCLASTPSECIEKRTYTTTVNLKDIPGGYRVVYQRCCRNQTITNLLNPEDEGATFWTTIPERKTYGDNSSPVFSKLPPNFLCVNQPLSFKHSATDKDGDSLYYSLQVPYHGASDIAPRPDTPTTGPYRRIIYNSAQGYGVANMINGSPGLKIDPVTGQLTLTPTRIGQFVVGIAVSEYRNGVLLSTTLRDFQLNVINCTFDVVSAFSTPSQRCDKQVTFSNLSKGALDYQWDFGDPATNSDKSSATNPQYTYPGPGKYDIRLIASSLICSDTFYKEIRIPHDSEFYAGPDTNICQGQAVQIGVPWRYPGTVFSWTPTNFLSNPNISNPFASPPSSRTYTLRKTFDFCYSEDDVSIRVGPPVPDFDFTLLENCRMLAANFVNSSQFATEYLWNFGTGDPADTSTEENPSFDFGKEGQYKVKLTVFLNGNCSADLEKTVDIKLDTTDFGGPSKEICFGDSVMIGSPNTIKNAQFSWSPAETVNPKNFPMTWAKPSKTTLYIVTRSIPECAITDSVLVTVDKPEPALQLAYEAPCDGLNIKVYNRSRNCDFVKWDFGVQGTETDTSSSKDSVKFTYPSNGQYIIELTGWSPKGCENSLLFPLDVLTDTGKFAGPDTNLCLGESLTLGYNDTVSFAKFKWYPDSLIKDDTLPNPSITPTQRMRYIAVKQYPECDFTDTVEVGVWNPVAQFVTDYDPHCDLFDIELTNLSTGANEFLWDLGHEGGIFRDTSKVVTAKFPKAGTYKVSLYAEMEHCADTTSRLISAYIDTGAYVIPDTVVCLNDSILVGRADTSVNAVHIWTPANGISDPDISNPWAYPGKTQVYVYERRFPGCTYFDTVKIRVADPLPLFDTTITVDCDGFVAELENLSQNASHYTWHFSNGESSTRKNEVQHFGFGELFKAELVAHDAHCSQSLVLEKELRPFDDFEVIRPNVFTPNGDGYNDCYTIEIPELPEHCHGFEIHIYNRWGQEVFTKEVDGNNYCWDGTNSRNGVAMETGTYFYIIDVKGRPFNGTLTLLY